MRLVSCSEENELVSNGYEKKGYRGLCALEFSLGQVNGLFHVISCRQKILNIEIKRRIELRKQRPIKLRVYERSIILNCWYVKTGVRENVDTRSPCESCNKSSVVSTRQTSDCNNLVSQRQILTREREREQGKKPRKSRTTQTASSVFVFAGFQTKDASASFVWNINTLADSTWHKGGLLWVSSRTTPLFAFLLWIPSENPTWVVYASASKTRTETTEKKYEFICSLKFTWNYFKCSYYLVNYLLRTQVDRNSWNV